MKESEEQKEQHDMPEADNLIRKWNRSQKKQSNTRIQRVFRTLMILLFAVIMVLLIYILVVILIDRMGW